MISPNAHVGACAAVAFGRLAAFAVSADVVALAASGSVATCPLPHEALAALSDVVVPAAVVTKVAEASAVMVAVMVAALGAVTAVDAEADAPADAVAVAKQPVVARTANVAVVVVAAASAAVASADVAAAAAAAAAADAAAAAADSAIGVNVPLAELHEMVLLASSANAGDEAEKRLYYALVSWTNFSGPDAVRLCWVWVSWTNFSGPYAVLTGLPHLKFSVLLAQQTGLRQVVEMELMPPIPQ